MKISLIFIIVITLCIFCENNEIINPVEEEKGYVAFIGRFDFSDINQPVFMHSGNAIRARFSGTSVTLKLEDEKLTNFFNVIIDNKQFVIRANRSDNTYVLAENLKNTVHTVEIFRRTEWHGGNSTFLGFEFNEGAKLLAPVIKDKKIEFIGDSYLCGFCNEISGPDEEFSYETENAYMTFGAISSRALNSEYISICYSGIGIVIGHNDSTFIISNYYDLLSNHSPVTWDYTHYQPNLVVIAMGSNDVSVGVDSLKFVDSYVNFLGRIRNNYSNVPIVCLAGPYSLNQNWRTFRNYVKASVEVFAKTDDKVYYFHFTPVIFDGCEDHPVVVEHQQLANELVPFIKQLMNW
ncbi:MAG TPA: SGNH/GDSL hydrolase family protein [Bacteroidales bacterium]|jgi:hypothetical protein|nr:SGNH/GDSL hydrolase family protein [Bacteroidales bacterium]